MRSFVAPSILSADFSNLEREIGMLNASNADWIHIDVMDGVFVPNISLGVPIVESIKKHAVKPLDVHLMIVHPERYVKAFYDAGASIISIHIEADMHLHRTLGFIKELGCKAGVAVNPHTPVSSLEDIVEEADVICLMSVNPGFGGQHFIENTYEKITKLKEMIDRKNIDTLIEIDGGVNRNNATKLLKTGADILVSGNFIFSSANPGQAIDELVKA